MNYISTLKFLLNPDKDFQQQKLDDHRKQVVILSIVMATTGVSLWLWDYATDPVGAMNTIWLRATFPLFAISYVAALLSRVNIRWLIVVAFMAMLGSEAVFLEILNRLNNGMTYGIAGFMFLLIMALLLLEVLSLRVNLTYTLCVAAVPHILAWTGYARNFQHIQYSAVVWPAATMIMVVQVIMAMNHWRRQDYQSRLAIQEEALRNANDELELRVAERTAELHLSEAKYRRFIDTANEGVWALDADLRTDLVNAQMADLLGYASEEILGCFPAHFIFEEDLHSHRNHMEKLRRGVSEHYEQRFRRKDGSELWVLISSTAIIGDDGGFRGAFAMLADITERKQVERELFKAKKLEIVGQLAGGVAHEVRNPLNSLLSISEALFREKDLAGNPEYEPYIMHIRTQVGRLSKLMSDLLDLGKPVKASNIQPVLLFEVLTDTVNLWKTSELASKCRLDFTCDRHNLNLPVIADPSRLQQALLNILDNAAQHSMKDDAISLDVGVPFDGLVTIWIRDVGKGIPPARLEKVFEPFFTTRTEGTGLGLPVVKHIFESMEGEVRLLNNDPAPGCTAELKLRIVQRKQERG